MGDGGRGGARVILEATGLNCRGIGARGKMALRKLDREERVQVLLRKEKEGIGWRGIGSNGTGRRLFTGMNGSTGMNGYNGELRGEQK
ncbi:unnamed protein product [Calypogeia fissa]